MKPLLRHCFLGALLSAPVFAADAPAPMKWTARQTTGQDITIPIADHVTVIAFLRAGQEQSDAAVRQIAETMSKSPDTKVIVALSGPTPADALQKFIAADQIAWPVVLDPDYAISGKMSVHVWPTISVLAADGTQAGHLAGLSQSFASDLSAYIDFAGKKIDSTALANRLTTKQVVTDSPEQMAARHLHMATTLLAKDQPDQAAGEIEAGLKLAPTDRGLRVAQVETLLKQKKPDAALAAADALKDAAPAWQVNLLRAQALIALERWPDAKSAVADAIKLNPNPASAHYLFGQVYAHEKDWEHAAASFRLAYESATTSAQR